ncbi:iron-containing alcohol dehydrogenase, partial [Catellicoccus marimammalium]
DHKEYEAKEGTLRLMELIQELKETLDMPSHFTDTKVTEDEFVNSIDMMSTSAMEDPCMLTNPRALTKDSVVSILNNLK